jgi:hypothetical protein
MIPDAETGLSWLAAKGLIAPSGTTPILAAETLFQVGALPNTPLQTLNGIHAVAFLLHEPELVNTTQDVSTIISRELTSFIDGLQSTFREKSEEATRRLYKMMSKLINQAKGSIEELGKATMKMINTTEKEKATAMPY